MAEKECPRLPDMPREYPFATAHRAIARPRIVIAGIGNPLGSDDSVGFHLCQKLADLPHSDDFRVVFLGTSPFLLLDHLRGGELLVIVDALREGGDPGKVTLREITLDSLNHSVPLTSHDLGLGEVLAITQKISPEIMPSRVVLIGIVGANFEFPCPRLCASVSASLDRIVECLLALSHDSLSGRDGGNTCSDLFEKLLSQAQ